MNARCFIRRSTLIFLGTLILIAGVPPLLSQVDTGTILGLVKDPSGAVVPAAQVTITNEATNQTMTSKTDSNGSYTFTPIPVGVYTVTASDSGFQKTVHTHVTVNIQEQTVANLTLVPGNVTQTVSVTAEPPLLQTQNASVQQVVTSKAINDLPLNGRNATYLARLDAGVTPAHNSGRGLTDSGSFSANGFGSLQNNYLLDGIDDNAEVGDLINQTQYVVMPPPDAVSEFTVQTNNYSAEFGHAAGAVLNATTKSGTNRLQGDLWEFIRNDHLDGTPFFLNAAGQQKAEYRLNQFGFTLGGPVVVPHIYHGRNKTFFFGYYQGTRIREGSTAVSTVPTVAERASGFTNFQDLIAGQSGTRKDILGRSFPLGTIFDPATTRAITKGQIDPVTGLMAPSTGYVRDPFYRGSLNGVTNFTTPAAEGLLNVIPANRLDPNAIKLVNLYPQPTGSSLLSNYTSAPIDMNDEDQGGIRIDQYFGENDRMFGSYALSDVVSTAPGPFPGLADGQANRPGSGTTTARNWAVSETHIFSPTFINEARFGYSRLHDVRLQLNGDDLSNIPAQFGIQGIPQVAENGGLPHFGIGGLGALGTGEYLPSDKGSKTLQVSENLTKIAGKHTLKIGGEFQNVRSPELSWAYPRGEFDYSGIFTSVVNQTDSSTGRAQFLLVPAPSEIAGGIDNLAGMNQLQATTAATQEELRHNYYGIYFQDDWRLTSRLTLNLGLRWDYFGWPAGASGQFGIFAPGSGFQGGQFLFLNSRKSEIPQGFINQLALDGLAMKFTNASPGSNPADKDFGPRFGFAYQATHNLVVRGGYAIFYGSGFSGNYIYQTFPAVVSNNFTVPNAVTPLTPDNSIGTLENGLLNVPLDAATATNFSAISMQGSQLDWKDAASQNYNAFLEYRLGKETSVSTGYVGSQSRHLIADLPFNTVATILPPGTNLQQNVFYPHFAQGGQFYQPDGNSGYNSFQVNLRHQAANLFMLANFTAAACRTTVAEVLIGGNNSGQAPYLPGFGPQYSTCVDGGQAKIFHFSGVYNLPFGKGQRILNKTGIARAVLGNWSLNWILTAEDGEPFTVGCPVATTAGLGCNALLVSGQDPYKGQQTPDHFLNAAAFANPPIATAIGQTDFAPLGGPGTQVTGPAFRDLDLSLFKDINFTETTRLQFRAEFFNATNTPSFSNPSFLNFSDTKNFGRITGTVSSPREIQLALKLYF